MTEKQYDSAPSTDGTLPSERAVTASRRGPPATTCCAQAAIVAGETRFAAKSLRCHALDALFLLLLTVFLPAVRHSARSGQGDHWTPMGCAKKEQEFTAGLFLLFILSLHTVLYS